MAAVSHLLKTEIWRVRGVSVWVASPRSEEMRPSSVPFPVVDDGTGLHALPAVEIDARGGVYDYTARYTPGTVSFHCPARLDAKWGVFVEAPACPFEQRRGCDGRRQ